MRYIEQIKSFLLTLLVLLSIGLTLLIWNYKPDYELIEETKVEEILIGETKELQDVLKPYRALYYKDNQFYGTVSPQAINKIYSQLTPLHPRPLELINSNLTDVKINELLRMDNRLTLFFNEELPLQVFTDIFTINDKDVPEESFNRLIIDWSNVETKDQLQLLFLNTEKRLLFRSITDISDMTRFLADVVEPTKDYSLYMEVQREPLLSLYVAQDAVESIEYTYLIEDTLPDTYKNLLFSDPTIVRNVESAQYEKYMDATSLMTVDTQNRILNYVYPLAESIAPISSSRLVEDSYDFINDHGGFTADYRLSSMNIDKHVVEYQLFLKGYPIYSNSTVTRIVTTWGENRIFRYRRPYYVIEQDIVRSVKELPSGAEIIAYLENNEDYSMKDIDEVVIGYYLTQDQDEEKLFLLEPCWFIISNNTLKRITPERIGGTYRGLE